jgi:hypothetical protein
MKPQLPTKIIQVNNNTKGGKAQKTERQPKKV